MKCKLVETQNIAQTAQPVRSPHYTVESENFRACASHVTVSFDTRAFTAKIQQITVYFSLKCRTRENSGKTARG
jgi:hypothetical protein